MRRLENQVFLDRHSSDMFAAVGSGIEKWGMGSEEKNLIIFGVEMRKEERNVEL